MTVTIHESQTYFLRDGRKFFYLADTAWSVFSNATLEEWEEYLDYRKAQGYNAVQISILPIIHDRTMSPLHIFPFYVREDGTWDFSRIDQSFFARAAKMTAMARDKGFVPCLVVLWGVYAPGNWMSRITNGSHVMPQPCVAPYAEYVSRNFSAYEPVYFISGDTNFEGEDADAYYLEAMRVIKRLEPEALISMHLSGLDVSMPERLETDPHMDFYVYQSSHGFNTQSNNYEMASACKDKPVKRPVLNSEPCYEGHGNGQRDERFGAFDVRKAFWWSVLSGASAGFAYGAHGIFSWHRKGLTFTNEKVSKTPFEWRTALAFDGASDAAFGKWLFERYDMFGWDSAQQLLAGDCSPDIRAAAAADLSTIAVYSPYPRHVELNVNPDGYRWEMFDLKHRYPIVPVVKRSEDRTFVEMPEKNADMLLIGLRV